MAGEVAPKAPAFERDDLRALMAVTGDVAAVETARMSNGAAYSQAQTVDHENREKDDFYPTWPGATSALLAVENFTGPIWECACGEGDMSRVLSAAGYEVISTDLTDRGFGEARVDFLMEWQPRSTDIVTNPPFSLAREFVDKALSLTTGKVAMFLRLAFLEGLKRGEWLPTTYWRASTSCRAACRCSADGCRRLATDTA